jgi:pyruvate,water dikinase
VCSEKVVLVIYKNYFPLDKTSLLSLCSFSEISPSAYLLFKISSGFSCSTGGFKSKTHTELCGQAPSDYPEYTKFLVQNKIDSISFNPDALIKGIENIAEAEKTLVINFQNHQVHV